jgi:hypothetical protein
VDQVFSELAGGVVVAQFPAIAAENQNSA